MAYGKIRYLCIIKTQIRMSTPLISVITVTYNAAGTLPATMQSIREQKCVDFEHLVIDGASTDDTLAVARRHSTPGLRILSEPDRGLYDAMNKGLRMARGKYVLFLNAGDRLATGATLSRYAMAAERDPDIIYGDTMIVDAAGTLLRPRHLSAPRVLTADSFARGMLVCHQAFMVRRELAPEFDTRYRLSADYDWCVRCIRATTPGRCENLRCVTIHYLDGGLTRRHKFESLRERFSIMSEHYGFFPTATRHVGFLFRAIRRHS